MRKSLVAEILEHLLVCGTSLMAEVIFAPYGQGLGRSVSNLERVAADCPHDFSLRSRRTVSATLSRLKRRGLVVNRGSRRKAVWKITEVGKRHFRSVKRFGPLALPPRDGKARLFIFDIPEPERGKRDWLRLRLLSCDYSPLQKSVWVGERPLPEEFFGELKERRMLSLVRVLGLEDTIKVRMKRSRNPRRDTSV